MELQPGHLLKRIYKIVRKIHEGGMGIVYLCTNIHTGALYVVKHPLYDGSNVDIKIEKLKVEANILKTLSHPHIVKYIDAFEENTVKLIDFGGAKMRFTSIQQKGSILYTPGYGAPEQQIGNSNFQSDIFGVGATMYFLLTGKDPCTLPPLSPCHEYPRVSRVLDSIVRKATHIDPNQRYQTVKEMKNALMGIIRASPLYNPRLIIGSREYPIVKSPFTIGRGGNQCVS